MPDTLMTVVVPVHNRPDELRRALRSIAAQTFTDFECIVVDDASTVAVEPVVREFDDRFVYVRNPRNTGPNGARRLAMERMAGEILIGLDSDDEYFPWALERAHHYLDTTPEADAVCGMYVFPDGLRGRVTAGTRLITPEQYADGALTLRCDLVGAFRRSVVKEWLDTRPDYFRLEFRDWLGLGMHHNQLMVDEPWAKVHFDAANRATRSTDKRIFADARRFVEECRPWLGTRRCVPLDDYLTATWFSLRVRRRPEAELLRSWIDERGISLRWVPARRIRDRFLRGRSTRTTTV